jgi:hypothetical protein
VQNYKKICKTKETGEKNIDNRLDKGITAESTNKCKTGANLRIMFEKLFLWRVKIQLFWVSGNIR